MRNVLLSYNLLYIELFSIFFSPLQVPHSTIDFALQRCNEYISSQQHKDIDYVDSEKVWDHQWDQFLTYYYQTVHDRAVFTSNNEDDLQVR